MTPAQHAAFSLWFCEYKQRHPSAQSVTARDAFREGLLATTIDQIKIEETVRAERNELAEHLRRIITGQIDAIDHAQDYLRQIGCAPPLTKAVRWDERVVEQGGTEQPEAAIPVRLLPAYIQPDPKAKAYDECYRIGWNSYRHALLTAAGLPTRGPVVRAQEGGAT